MLASKGTATAASSLPVKMATRRAHTRRQRSRLLAALHGDGGNPETRGASALASMYAKVFAWLEL